MRIRFVVVPLDTKFTFHGEDFIKTNRSRAALLPDKKEKRTFGANYVVEIPWEVARVLSLLPYDLGDQVCGRPHQKSYRVKQSELDMALDADPFDKRANEILNQRAARRRVLHAMSEALDSGGLHPVTFKMTYSLYGLRRQENYLVTTREERELYCRRMHLPPEPAIPYNPRPMPLRGQYDIYNVGPYE